MREWLDRDPKNVIAVHCKGGKGTKKSKQLYFILLYFALICINGGNCLNFKTIQEELMKTRNLKFGPINLLRATSGARNPNLNIQTHARQLYSLAVTRI